MGHRGIIAIGRSVNTLVDSHQLLRERVMEDLDYQECQDTNHLPDDKG